MSLKFAGIGSRETPDDVLELMRQIAEDFCSLGFTLRSGGAKGADTAFESGCNSVNGDKQIYYPKDTTEESIELSLKYHPNPEALKKKGEYVLGLMGRNMQIISGHNLDDNVEFVVCYTSNGKKIGGTANAMRYAEDLDIPIYNLYFEEDCYRLSKLYDDYNSEVIFE